MAFDPLMGGLAAAGMGTSLWGLLEGKRAQKRAREEMENRRQQILGLLRTQGESAKAGIAEGGMNERADISQGLINRGLYNTTTLDTLSNMSRSREARDKARVDENIAGQTAGMLNSWDEGAPDTSGAMEGLAKSGALLGATLWDSFKSGPKSTGSQSPALPKSSYGSWDTPNPFSEGGAGSMPRRPRARAGLGGGSSLYNLF